MMFDYLFKKPEPKPCSHPKWEIVKEIELPSIIEQMKLDTLTPESKEKILLKATPSDFDKQILMVMSCPFCGLVKEFKTESKNSTKHICNHQWEIIRHVTPSSFEQTCGDDATFEQRMKVASALGPYDFRRAVREITTCKICGERKVNDYDEGQTCGASERCAHDWKLNYGQIEEAFSRVYQNSSEIQLSQSVLLTCNICGKTKVEKLSHEFKIKGGKV